MLMHWGIGEPTKIEACFHTCGTWTKVIYTKKYRCKLKVNSALFINKAILANGKKIQNIGVGD